MHNSRQYFSQEHIRRHIMKHINKIILCGFLVTVLFSCLDFTVQSETLSEKLIRLHVKANSDSEIDQQIKLIVKDEINACVEILLENAQSLEQAQTIIENNLEQIQEVANETLQELSVNYCANVTLCEEYFCTREYETFTLPAGYYTSLKVDLGEALGENWWCVVYPALCNSVAIESDITQDELSLIEESPEIKFKIYEIYLDIVRFFGQ